MDAGYYGPQSLTWRLTSETVMLLGGPRALLLQLAHPLVAAGVADHSTFRQDPFRRLRRTLDATLAMVFGTRAEAEAAAAAINGVHQRVRGVLREDVGRFRAGTPYDATDPELLLWVHATLVDTTLEVYPRFVAPLSPQEQERAYQESKVAARLLLVPEQLLPPDLGAFRRYVQEMLDSDTIAVGPTQRELGAAVLHPLPRLPRWLFEVTTAITAGLLPPKLREGFGVPLTPAREQLFRWAQRVLPRAVPLLPRVVREMPQARRARRRLGAA